MKNRRTQVLFCVGATLALLAIALSVAYAEAGQASLSRAASPPSTAPLGTRQAGTGWSSGWLDIAPGQVMTLTHNLGGNADEYTVDLWYRDVDGGLGINHRAYGGMEAGGQFYGLAWQRLTDTTVQVFREGNDIFGDQVLVRIWTADPPDYDSGWQDVAPDQMLTLTHNLLGNVDDYVVGMKFRDTRPQGFGVHQRYAGGFELNGKVYGAAWDQLTDTTVRAHRFPDDVSVGQVRILIYRPDPPDYDSGWQAITPGQAVTLTHNLGGNPMAYVVRASARSTDPTIHGINTWYVGGFEVNGSFFGSNWERLTGTTIRMFRFPHDSLVRTADEVRVRIWVSERKLYLPFMSKSSNTLSLVQ